MSNSSTHSSDLTEWKRRIAQTSRLTVTAVLLVGGESRRMGTDKSTILCRGKPLWQNQIETLRKLQPKELFVSARSDPAWRPNDIQFVADIPPSRGPLSGLAACLDRMKTTHLLALAIDMPWMTCEYLEFLCAQMGPACGAVPKIASRAEPLGAIYPREAATEFRNALRGTDFSLQSLIRELVAGGKLREIVVTEQHKSLFLNVNEPADLLEGGADGIDLA